MIQPPAALCQMRDSEAQSATAEEELFPSRYRFFNPDAFDQQASIQLIRFATLSLSLSLVFSVMLTHIVVSFYLHRT